MEKYMESNKEIKDFKGDFLSDELAKDIAVMALISAAKERYDYASGQDFPNIPFGD